MATTGHESEAINVQGLKASLQKFKTDKVDGKSDKSATVSTVSYDTTNKKLTKTINGTTSDIVSTAKLKTDMSLSKSDVGLDNVTNDSQVKRSEMGANNGVATLGSDGKVPSSQLPSYVDDVLEYANKSSFPATGETGKIYVDKSTDTTWRWSGSVYTQIKGDLALGETSSTAYRGDRGKTAYDHSQSTHARTDATKTEASSTNGNIKINGTETTVYTHPSGTNPHGTTKSDVGLGNVTNDAQVKRTEMGVNNGVATLNASGKVPNSQLPPFLGEDEAKAIAAAINEVGIKAQEVTWAELYTLRQYAMLIPGMWYRITDYECTTTQENTQAASNQFDILVLATSSDTLSENARAAKHSGDVEVILYKTNIDAFPNEVDYTDYFKYIGTFEYDGDTYYRWRKYEEGEETGYSILTTQMYEAGSLSLSNPDTNFIILNADDEDYGGTRDDGLVLAAGGDYFGNIDAWQLRYTLDNVKWSRQTGLFATSENDGYSFKKVGTIVLDGDTYILWEGDSKFQDNWCNYAVSLNSNEGSSLYAYYEDGEFSDEEVDTIGELNEVTEPGKGTVLWMKDEFDNECPYDFKNIQFKRYKATDAKSRDSINGKYMVADPNNPPQNITGDSSDFIWAYTFSSNASGGAQSDASLDSGVHDNVFRKYGDSLPNNVIYGYNTYANSFGCNCYNNSIGNNCYNNSIGNYFQFNSIGNNFNSNSIGNDCYYNTIGEYFRYNTIGYDCYYNTIGNGFQNNTIGNSFGGNSIGNNCYRNSIGNGFQNNTIGEYFNYNTIGNNFNSNSIGNYFQFNSIGNNFNSNSIGNNFNSNSIGNGCQNIRIQKDFVYYIIIENGNQYIDITSNKTTSSSSVLRNFTVAQGVNNTTTRKTISHNSVNDTFKTTYQNASSTTVNI